MSGVTIARLVGSAVLLLTVTVLLWRLWAWARYESRGGKPMSGLPLVIAWGATFIAVPVTLLLLIFVLIPWDLAG